MQRRSQTTALAQCDKRASRAAVKAAGGWAGLTWTMYIHVKRVGQGMVTRFLPTMAPKGQGLCPWTPLGFETPNPQIL